MRNGFVSRWLLGIVLTASMMLPMLFSTVVVAQESTVTPQPTPTTGPAGGVVLDAVGVTKTIEPTRLLPGQEATVTITLHGEAFEECLGIPGAPLDVILIVDNSVSARAWGRLDKAKAIAQSFMDQLSYPVYLQWDQPPLDSRVGIVTSNYTEQGPQTELVELNRDFSAARAKVETIGADADTGLDEGLRIAHEELTRKERRQARPMVLLILHDNVPFTPEASTAAQELRRAGIDIYVLGVGRKADLDEKEVIQLAGDAKHFVFEPQPDGLFRIFVQATGGATDLAAKDYRISDDFWPPGLVEVVRGSVRGQGANIEASIEDGKPVWRVPLIKKGETVVLSYQVRVPRTGVGGQVQLVSATGWLCCNGCFHNWAVVPDARETIDVLLPTATPTATEAPVPSPTPTVTESPVLGPMMTMTATPTGTNTPSPVTTQPVPAEEEAFPTPIPVRVRIPILGPLSDRLLPFIPLPWRQILLILAIPLLLWLLWQLLKLLRRRTPSAAPEVISMPPPERPVSLPTRIQEPTPQPEPVGAAMPGPEGDDEALLQELLEARSWQGHIITTELGLREPWPMEVRTAIQPAEIAALALRNKGEAFYWLKEDGTALEVPVQTLEKALAQVAKSRCPVVVVGHRQSTDNLEIAVDIFPNALKKQEEVAVRAVYQEPQEGQEQSPLKFYLHIQAVEDPIGTVAQAPILEQNL